MTTLFISQPQLHSLFSLIQDQIQRDLEYPNSFSLALPLIFMLLSALICGYLHPNQMNGAGITTHFALNNNANIVWFVDIDNCHSVGRTSAGVTFTKAV